MVMDEAAGHAWSWSIAPRLPDRPDGTLDLASSRSRFATRPIRTSR